MYRTVLLFVLIRAGQSIHFSQNEHYERDNVVPKSEKRIPLSYSYVKYSYVAILDVFEEHFWEASVRFFMFVCPSLCIEQLITYWMDFHEIPYFSIYNTRVIYTKKF